MTLRYFSPVEPASSGALILQRRGLRLGWVAVGDRPAAGFDVETVKAAWRDDQAVWLPGILSDALPNFAADVAQAQRLMEQTLEGVELNRSLEDGCYAERLQADFAQSTVSFEDHDPQGIEKVYFDAWRDDDLVADNLWCKASWLSLDPDDASLRYRFSFGMEGYEDVASDPERQQWAARLTDAVFPESAAITRHERLNGLLAAMLDGSPPLFAERIVYFNAPNGGALMHHDVERGHEGVLFAQMSGATFWLALSQPRLLDEIIAFLAESDDGRFAELRAVAMDRAALAAHLNDPDHEPAEELMDRSPEFIGRLVERGYAYVLQPGDVLLMPQRALETCVWHTVFCLGDAPGEGLSFALKKPESNSR